MEDIIMQLIMNAGDAKSDCIIALQEARQGNFDKAFELLDEANKKILVIHRMQSEMMQKECSGEKVELSILLVHAQDHLTNAIVTFDLANEFISYMSETEEKLKKLEK